jgi:hypothetical protein
MTISRCPKCGKGVFQVESIMPHGWDKSILCVICHTCNSILGAIDDAENKPDNKEIELQFQVLNKKLETVNNNIGQLMNGLKLLYNKLDGIKKSEE